MRLKIGFHRIDIIIFDHNARRCALDFLEEEAGLVTELATRLSSW